MSNRNIEVILFWNKRGHCMKVLIYDGLGIQKLYGWNKQHFTGLKLIIVKQLQALIQSFA